MGPWLINICVQGCSLSVIGSASRKSISFILQESRGSLVSALSADAKRLTKILRANFSERAYKRGKKIVFVKFDSPLEQKSNVTFF